MSIIFAKGNPRHIVISAILQEKKFGYLIRSFGMTTTIQQYSIFTMKKVAITSMYANPLHPGHVESLMLSKALVDELIVIVNNDHQARLKRGVESFQDEQFRLTIIQSLKPVDHAMLSIDEDPSVCKTLELVITELKKRTDVSEIIFTKGGDRFAHEIPERAVLEKYDVKIIDGLGTKTHHSSLYAKK